MRLSPISVAILLLVAPTTARAEGLLRPHAHGKVVVEDGRVAGGGHLGLSGGYNVELDPLLIEPEATASFGGFGGEVAGFDARALGGLRVGVETAVEPSIVLRGGYGHITLDRGAATGLHGGALQVGVAVDDRLSRELSVGGEVTYDAFLFDGGGGTEVIHTVSAGLAFHIWL